MLKIAKIEQLGLMQVFLTDSAYFSIKLRQDFIDLMERRRRIVVNQWRSNIMKAIFLGSIGTIADTSELQLKSFNLAFEKHGLEWSGLRMNILRCLKLLEVQSASNVMLPREAKRLM